jgi:hypothetical protein
MIPSRKLYSPTILKHLLDGGANFTLRNNCIMEEQNGLCSSEEKKNQMENVPG